MLKQRWLSRGPLKPGEIQMGKPKWMETHPDYKSSESEQPDQDYGF
jgi:hypothetical protein